MAEKIGAGNEPQNYDEKNGRYTKESGNKSKEDLKIFLPSEKEYIDVTPSSERKIFVDKKSARDYFAKTAKDWEQSLSDGEKEAVKGYTDLTYDKINTYLRDPKAVYVFRDFNKAVIDAQINGIDNAISKFSLKDNLTVYSGTNVIEFGKDLNDIEDVKELIGNTLFLNGYTSSSTNKEVADKNFDGEVLIEYNVPKGIGRGAYIDFISVMQNLPEENKESEFLLKRGSKIRITNVTEREDGKIIVNAEIL